ncbi:PQQ-binding-like beta-propeller repeat protein [soil metagenome]
MKRISTIKAVGLILISSFILHPSSFASDWPQFRGSGSTGYATDSKLPETLKAQWAAVLPGRGLSSPIVVGDKVFITAASGPKQEKLHVICFKAVDGGKVWERQLKATGRTMAHEKTSVAAPSPCSDGKHIFALWSCNDLVAFDLEGNLLWTRGLTVDYANASNSLGMASSPMVVGETVVVVIENDSESYSLGIDVNTGRNLWKMERPKAANWSSPIVYKADAQSAPVVVLQSKDGLVAVDPATGSRLWEYTDGASTMSSSVAANGIIYAPSHGLTALKPDKNGAAPEQLWRNEQLNPSTISPVVVGDSIYSINSASVMTVASLKDGERGWKLRLTGPVSASPVAAGKRIAVVSEKGVVQIVDTTAPEGAVTTQMQLPLLNNQLILSTPSLQGNSIFVRSDGHLWRLGE